jgi:hypothetical protein
MVEAIMEGRCPRYELDRALDGGYVLVFRRDLRGVVAPYGYVCDEPFLKAAAFS